MRVWVATPARQARPGDVEEKRPQDLFQGRLRELVDDEPDEADADEGDGHERRRHADAQPLPEPWPGRLRGHGPSPTQRDGICASDVRATRITARHSTPGLRAIDGEAGGRAPWGPGFL